MGTRYKAYLLRLRRDEGQHEWRASLEDAHTGKLLRFTNQNEMLRYLLQDLSHTSGGSSRVVKEEDLFE